MGTPQALYFEDLKVGMSAQVERRVDDALIRQFAALSGDYNPVHLDAGFAAGTRFGGRIAHGMLGAAFISAVLGTQLPGPGTIYLSQTLSFRRPVRLDDTVVAEATVTELQPEKSRAVLRTIVRVGDRVVIEGEALVMVPKRN